jgi:hypothetical protein
MNPDLMQAITVLAGRFMAQALIDDGLRDDVRALAGAILFATERPPSMTPVEPSPLVAGNEGADLPRPHYLPAVELEAVTTATMPNPVRTGSPLPELTLGRLRPIEPATRTEPAPEPAKRATTDVELPGVEARCRLKAEGLRWAATRRRLKDVGADFRSEIAPRDQEILDRAGGVGCYLWMSTPEFVVPPDPSSLEGVAEWFDATADVVAMIRGMLPDVEGNREFFEPALDLMAEAQSALRVSIDRISGPGDPEQYRAYDWLRGVAAREQIYISRHMRLDDPADSAILPEVKARIEALDTRFQEVRGRAKRKKSALNRLRYHAKLISEGGGEHDWRKVAGAIDELLDLGVPASNVEVREVVLPIFDMMLQGEDLSPGFNLVLREIDHFLANRTPTTEAAEEVLTAEVAEASRLLKGKCALMVGGVRRPESHEALKAAFGLEELVWFETREHESIDVFEPYVARPEVALVLLAIRWSSHSFGDVKRFCDDHGKPMVRLPGGYGVNQVAAQILAQGSGRLGGG